MNGLGIKTVSRSVEEKIPADLEYALTVAGFGWYTIQYCFVLGLFLITAVVGPQGYSYILPAAKCDLHLTDAQRGFIISIPYACMVITSYPWGYLVDTRGRRKIIIFSSLIAWFFGSLAAFMPETISFTICTCLSSLCVAAPAAIPFSFIGEITPPKYRDLTLSFINAFQIAGTALVPLLAWVVLPLDFRKNFGLYDFRPWRLLAIVNSLLYIISATWMYFGPESPKYLVSQGKHDEALKVLQVIYAKNKGKLPEEYPVQQLLMPQSYGSRQSFLTSLKEQTLPLFKPPLLKWMALTGFLLFGVFSTLNGLYVWVPDILNRVISGLESEKVGERTACDIIAQRLNETVTQGKCDDSIEVSTYKINSIAIISCAVIALAASSLVNLIGKRALMIAVYLIMGSLCVSINFTTNQMLFAALLSSLLLTCLAVGPVNSYGVDIFPTHFRGMGISLAMMFGRLGSAVGANLAGTLINAHCEATFYTFGGLLLLCGALSLLLPWSSRSEKISSDKEQTHL